MVFFKTMTFHTAKGILPLKSMGCVLLKNTIKENRDFRFAYKRGKKIVTPYIVMHYYKNRTDTTKIGITVSTSVGKAHVRNHIKRLVREAFYVYSKEIKCGYNIVWVSRSKTAYASFDDVKKSVFTCLSNAGLLNDAQNG